MEVIYTDIKFRRPLIKLDPDKVDTIFIHHPKWKTASVETIHNDVLNDPEKKNWNGFPYNEYIRKDHKVYIGRGDKIGAHVANYNSRSYGICIEGDYSVEPAPPDSLITIAALRTIEAQRRFPKATMVQPHSHAGGTECPGRNFPMKKLYDEIKRLKSGVKDKRHWGETIYENLEKEFGIIYHEKRFDDKTSRAESMTMQLESLRAMKRYIDSL